MTPYLTTLHEVMSPTTTYRNVDIHLHESGFMVLGVWVATMEQAIAVIEGSKMNEL